MPSFWPAIVVLLVCVLPAAVLKLALALGWLGPTPMGFINQIWEPHRIALAVNPPFAFVSVLQREADVLREEFASRREAALRPRSDFRSKDYPGAVKDDSLTEGWSTLYLRVGTVDTCLTRHFPKTMRVLDQQLGTRVHTAFFSELNPDAGAGRSIPPHCGQLRGLFRVLTVLGGEKAPGASFIASQGALPDHDMCLSRFASECPANVTEHPDAQTVHYNVGDVVLFNDFCCHWVENYSIGPRLALVINVDRPDLATWRNTLTAWGSRLFASRKLGIFIEGSKKICAALDEAAGAS
jgi:aspartyl/asparaginyl beta-hydroxylase (cupin superfamily)